ncbi:putative transporter YfdV [Caballeronia glebae]|uniref:Transporter YfdV n=1 Tax=Caballeronia glebae TaxID=1777143 RepID=A0A157Z5H9_9BURK|nr:AEC family transporter [Caballeronia glebae]SAK40798.1 putative transporter YfdV [Caballeronia glebae]
MAETIIAALLPIVITLLFGFLAGWHHDFDSTQGAILNRMVMLYALPLSLFSGMMGIPREVLLAQGTIAMLLLAGMVGGYAVIFLLARYLFRRSTSMSALLALATAGPGVPFVGVPVLGHLFGNLSTVPIALSSIIMNLVQVPVTLLLLSKSSGNGAKRMSFGDNLLHTIKEPVVWAPILAFALLLANVHIPDAVRSSLQLLGGATGGVALFASGVILYSYHVAFNRTVAISVLLKNVLLPLAIIAVSLAIGANAITMKISVITLSIPTASICVMLAVQYKTAEQEIASILFFSTVLSILTMGGFLYYFH